MSGKISKHIKCICVGLFASAMVVSAQPEKWLKEGMANFDAGNYPTAVVDFTKVIDHQPTDYLPYYYRGMTYLYTGKYLVAEQDLNRAIELKPNSADAYNSRGLCRGYLNKVNEAIQDFTSAIQYDTEFAQAYANRASAYISISNFEKAKSDLLISIQIDKNNPAPVYNLARIYYGKGEFKQAAKYFSKSIALGMNKIDVYTRRANSYFQLKKYKRSIKDYTYIIGKEPKNTKALNNRAIAYEKSGKKKLATKDRNILEKMRGYSTPPFERIKFKIFSSADGVMKLSLPKSWHRRIKDGEYAETIISEKKVNKKSDHPVNVSIVVIRDVGTKYNLTTPQDILEFWEGSQAKNVASYYKHEVFSQRQKLINDYPSKLLITQAIYTPQSTPMVVYEYAVANDKDIAYVYFQAPSVDFDYYKKIFDKAVSSVEIFWK